MEYDRVTAENRPRLSQSVIDACALQANEKGLTYERLAVQVVIMQRQLDRQKAQQSGPQVPPAHQLFRQFRNIEEPKTMQDFLYNLSNLIENELHEHGLTDHPTRELSENLDIYLHREYLKWQSAISDYGASISAGGKVGFLPALPPGLIAGSIVRAYNKGEDLFSLAVHNYLLLEYNREMELKLALEADFAPTIQAINSTMAAEANETKKWAKRTLSGDDLDDHLMDNDE